MMPYMGTGLSGVSEWEQKVLELVRQVEAVLDGTNAPLRIWMRNNLEALMLATEPGATVSSGTLTREEMMMYSALFQAALAFRDTPIAAYVDEQGQVVQMTPDAIIGYRRVPVVAETLLGGVATQGGVMPTTRPAGKPASALPLSAPSQEKE